jgi:hypothetical protein
VDVEVVGPSCLYSIAKHTEVRTTSFEELLTGCDKRLWHSISSASLIVLPFLVIEEKPLKRASIFIEV